MYLDKVHSFEKDIEVPNSYTISGWFKFNTLEFDGRLISIKKGNMEYLSFIHEEPTDKKTSTFTLKWRVNDLDKYKSKSLTICKISKF